MTAMTTPNHHAEEAAVPAASSTDRVASRDGTELLVRRWPARLAPWASVLLVHGLAEHSGRYEHVGRWLAEAGLDVEAYDQRGFGASGGRRAYVERWTENHDDLEDRLAALRSRAGAAGRPVVVYGHSLGGAIALGYAIADPPRPLPDALVLSAPAIDSTIPGWKRFVARVLGSVMPTGTLKNDLDGGILSRDPAVGEQYASDPLNQHATTFRFGAEALREQGRIRGAFDRLSIPTLVYHGGEDRLVPTASSEVLGTLPGVERRVYPGLRHESHNEPEGPAVIADVVTWLRGVVPSVHN